MSLKTIQRLLGHSGARRRSLIIEGWELEVVCILLLEGSSRRTARTSEGPTSLEIQDTNKSQYAIAGLGDVIRCGDYVPEPGQVDPSIWVAHLKQAGGHLDLIAALEAGVVVGHPFVPGELVLAGAPVDSLFAGVPMLPIAPHEEVVEFVARMPKPVRQIGWVDMHIVYSALVHHCDLLTGDRPRANLHGRLRIDRRG